MIHVKVLVCSIVLYTLSACAMRVKLLFGIVWFGFATPPKRIWHTRENNVDIEQKGEINFIFVRESQSENCTKMEPSDDNVAKTKEKLEPEEVVRKVTVRFKEYERKFKENVSIEFCCATPFYTTSTKCLARPESHGIWRYNYTFIFVKFHAHRNRSTFKWC